VLKALPGPSYSAGQVWWRSSVAPVLSFAGIFVLSLLLSKAVVMGELYPFGASFLAAVCVTCPKYVKAALLGVIAGTALAIKGWMLASYLFGIILLYGVLHRQRETEGSWFLVPGLVLAIHFLGRGAGVFFLQNELYQWIGVCFESFFAGVLTLVAVTGLRAYPRAWKGDILTAEERTSLGLIILGGVIGIGPANIGGIGLQSVISRWLVLWGAFLGGPGGGSAAGVAVGLIPSIGGSLTTGPIAFYALSGMLGGIFNSFKKPGVIVGFSLANLLLSLFFPEQVVIEQTFMETAVAAVGFLLLQLPGIKEGLTTAAAYQQEHAAGAAGVTLDRLKKMPQILDELGKILRTNKDNIAKSPELSVLFNRVAAKVCEGCSLHRVCWKKDFYKTYRAMLDACTRLETAGAITEKDFGAEINRRCMRLRELSTTLNSQLETFKLINSFEKQIQECKSLVYNQLNGMARVVEDFAEDLQEEISYKDPEIPLKRRLEEKGILVKSIKKIDLPDGEEEIIINQAPCGEKNWCGSMVAPNISQVLGKTYRLKSKSCAESKEDSYCSYHLVPSSTLQVRVGQAQLPKEGVRVSGDVCASFAIPDQRFVLVLSDGMGAGPEACAESTTAIGLLEKLLEAGFSVETAVKTINTVLFLRSGKENFVTLDVVIINLINGRADFIKIGGAPSLIFSYRGMKQVQAFVPPAGILDTLALQAFRHQIVPGNIIIMMSDGVWEALHNAGGPVGWLEDVLKKMDLNNPQQMAVNLLYLAEKAAGSTKDDMTVLVARIDLEEIA